MCNSLTHIRQLHWSMTGIQGVPSKRGNHLFATTIISSIKTGPQWQYEWLWTILKHFSCLSVLGVLPWRLDERKIKTGYSFATSVMSFVSWIPICHGAIKININPIMQHSSEISPQTQRPACISLVLASVFSIICLIVFHSQLFEERMQLVCYRFYLQVGHILLRANHCNCFQVMHESMLHWRLCTQLNTSNLCFNYDDLLSVGSLAASTMHCIVHWISLST